MFYQALSHEKWLKPTSSILNSHFLTLIEALRKQLAPPSGTGVDARAARAEQAAEAATQKQAKANAKRKSAPSSTEQGRPKRPRANTPQPISDEVVKDQSMARHRRERRYSGTQGAPDLYGLKVVPKDRAPEEITDEYWGQRAEQVYKDACAHNMNGKQCTGHATCVSAG